MYTCNPSASERQAASATRQVPCLSGLRDTVSKAKTESREMDSALPPCTEAKSTILCPSDLHRQAFLGSQSTSQSKHSGSSVTCYNTCSQTGVLLLCQVSLGSARGGAVWSQDGRIGLSRLLYAHRSCLFSLQTNNSGSDGDGLRQNCTWCLFLHSGVSIKFYWLLAKCRAASYSRSGLRLLQVAKLSSGGS